MKEPKKKCCDNCKYYQWYYDKCDLFNAEVDGRSVCDSYEERYNSEMGKTISLVREEDSNGLIVTKNPISMCDPITSFRYRGRVATPDELDTIDHPRIADIALVGRVPIDETTSKFDVTFLFTGNDWQEMGMEIDEEEENLSTYDLIRFTKLMDKRCKKCPKNKCEE